jgi:hypothetical protein
VCFAFASHKNEENVRRIVGSYEGYLQSDAYICYELIAAASENRIMAVGCWAHARRKFEPLFEAGPHPQAAWILGEIQKLYDIEDRARAMTDDERLALRQAESRPIVMGIKAWLDARDQDELPKSPLRAGINDLRNRWEAFERFLEDGRIPIDNNRTEAMIKGPVMGKKAWLFFGNEPAGETAAVFYTLTMTCKRHNIDVQAYLLDVFRRIRTATPAELNRSCPIAGSKSIRKPASGSASKNRTPLLPANASDAPADAPPSPAASSLEFYQPPRFASQDGLAWPPRTCARCNGHASCAWSALICGGTMTCPEIQRARFRAPSRSAPTKRA